MANKNITHKQHYLPQMYLKFFTYDVSGNQVWTMNSFLSIKSRHLEEICYKKDIYEFQNDNISKNIVEDLYGKLENYFAPRLKQIILKIENKKTLNDDEIIDLYAFYQTLFYRHPYILEFGSTELVNLNLVNHMTLAQNAIRTFGSFNLNLLVDQLLKTHKLKIGINHTEIPFIMSNFPFNMEPRNKCFGDQRLYLPLTPKIMMMFIPKKIHKHFDNYEVFNNAVVDLFNFLSCNRQLNQDFLLISNNKEILEYYKNFDDFQKDCKELIEARRNKK